MEVFTHINEIAREGWACLRTLVLAAPRVVLWGPSASFLDEARSADPSLPTTQELLWYIENGHIQVIARHWWLQNEDQRKRHPWVHARTWTNFDDAVLDMWRSDQSKGKTRSTARVLAAGEEVGWQWARAETESGRIDLTTFHIDAQELLPGYREKAQRENSGPEFALSLLRDAKNHGDAFCFSRADRNLGSPGHEQLGEVLLRAAQSATTQPVPYLAVESNTEALVHAVHSVLEKIGRAKGDEVTAEEAFVRTQSLLADSKELENIRMWIGECDMLAGHLRDNERTTYIARRLAHTIMEHSPVESVFEYLLPASPIQKVSVIAGLGLGVAGAILGSPTAPISLVLFGLRPAEALLKRMGWLPEGYSGPRWPFYVADGSRTSRRQVREAILRALHQVR